MFRLSTKVLFIALSVRNELGECNALQPTGPGAKRGIMNHSPKTLLVQYIAYGEFPHSLLETGQYNSLQRASVAGSIEGINFAIASV